MSKLFVFGDSFSSIEINGFGEEKVWPTLLANRLNKQLVNGSMIGASQDFIFWLLYDQREQITKDDQIIVVLTHPSRMWYVENDPSLSKPSLIKELENVYGSEYTNAAHLYERYIQTPGLDQLHVEQRLAWLSYTAYLKEWKPPIVVEAFDQLKPQSKEFKHIIIGNGNLTTDVSEKEIKGGIDLYNKIFKGYDPRFNHMCLCNHSVLVDKLFDTITNGATLDFTTGFYKDAIDESALNNQEFVDAQLSRQSYDRRKHELTAKQFKMFRFFQG
jgi:hypothetical protein